MAEYRGLSGKIYQLQTTPFAGGGEGDIYDIFTMPTYVAKVYKQDERTIDRERKLSVMVSNKPNVMEQYAWPLDVLYENNGQFIGYIMPKINGKEKLRNIYVYDNRKGKPWSLYIAIAKNLAAAVYNVHEIHLVVGDLNPENILVNPNDGMVTLVDTDSYHISDSGRTYRCRKAMPEFVAPELQDIHFPSAPLPTFTQESDCFALSVLIFALLMNGSHPYSCKVISGSASKFQPIDNIKNGNCAFFTDSRSSNMDIPPYAPDLNSLPDNIQKLFRRAFVSGHKNHSLRPSAEEWYKALEQMENNLKTCPKNTQHIYYNGVKECPWCKVDEKMHSIAQSSFSYVSPITRQFVPPVQPQQITFSQPTKKKNKGWSAIAITLILTFFSIFSFYRYQTNNTTPPAGSYNLFSTTMEGNFYSKNLAKIHRKMRLSDGKDYYTGNLNLKQDGTGVMTFEGESHNITWDSEKINVPDEDETYKYNLSDNKFTVFVTDDTTLVFETKNSRIWLIAGVLLTIICLIYINLNTIHKFRNTLIVLILTIAGFVFIKPNDTINKQIDKLEQTTQIVNKKDNTRKQLRYTSSLFKAIKRNDIEKAEKYINMGADVNGRYERDEMTPLIYASDLGRVEMVELLLKSDVDLNAVDKKDRRAINYLLMPFSDELKKYGKDNDPFKRVRILELLIKAGVDVNAVNKYGETPLMEAAYWCDYYRGEKYTKCVDLLINSGADVNAKDIRGESALIKALKKDNHGIANQLRAAGAKE